MNRLVQYTATLSLAGMVAAALFVLGGTSIFSPALATHEASHDEIARGKIGDLQNRVWSCENNTDPCEGKVGLQGEPGEPGKDGSIGPKGDDGSAGFDGPLATLVCTEGETVRYGATSDGSVGWICDDGSGGTPVTASCPCSVFTDGSLASKGLIEIWTASAIERECFPKNATPLSRDDCVALFVCNYSTVLGTTTISLGSTGTEPFSWYTEWTLLLKPNKCSARVRHEFGDAFPAVALTQVRTVGLVPPLLAWFENSLEFSQAEVDACAGRIPWIIDGIEVAIGELLETDFKCTDLTPPS